MDPRPPTLDIARDDGRLPVGDGKVVTDDTAYRHDRNPYSIAPQEQAYVLPSEQLDHPGSR
ncbi:MULTISPECIES: hypothetical protein [unclassified Mycobacteroides]|uniref:hypothetical protein n=1 Tax=unclassified Mycobacteroides TaxID=2618759 RepID=UPI0012DD4944|nr:MULTISPECIES: hypothetical protein [unclassified Mycobacteroides]MUM19392.1 hypothetical protein [Mycobacteroides sp. CBMA 326]